MSLDGLNLSNRACFGSEKACSFDRYLESYFDEVKKDMNTKEKIDKKLIIDNKTDLPMSSITTTVSKCLLEVQGRPDCFLNGKLQREQVTLSNEITGHEYGRITFYENKESIRAVVYPQEVDDE